MADSDAERHEKSALEQAIGAVVTYYNGVCAEKDAEIAQLRAEVERLADRRKRTFTTIAGGGTVLDAGRSQ